MEPIFFTDKQEFRNWLEKNFDKENELLVGFYKKGSGRENMSWSESVDVAISYGWIDGVRRSVDKDSYCIRFTPRRPGSNWSRINIEKIKALTEQGVMHPAGIEAFSKRKEGKQGVYSYENDDVKLPKELEQQFRKNKDAWSFWKKQAPSYHKISTRWIVNGKQEATRLRRLAKLIAASAEKQRLF